MSSVEKGNSLCYVACGVLKYSISALTLCFLCSGHAAYATAVEVFNNNTQVGASYFMTFHTILKESPDYIDALKMARILADNISQTMDHKVFAYRWVLLLLSYSSLCVI